MDNRLSKITIVLFVLSFIMTAIGGTFAWLSASANITNGTYTAMTHCFLVDYNIDNGDGTQDITGTMFPSANALGGLNGRVGLKINDSCELYGTGTLKLHINSETSSALTNNVASYCESRKTLEKIDGITTKEACTTANGRWMGYGDSYCENPTTLERMKDYTTQSDCTSNGGTWTSGGSPLKYALYYNEYGLDTPLSVGHITSNDIEHDITLKNDILVTEVQEYYYIYVWLDGYMTDNTFTDLAFSGSVSATAIQNNDAKTNAYTVTFDPNGGTVSKLSKKVIYGEQYGELPTPTREGYTFKGWHGRNYYNVSDKNGVTGGVTVDSNDWITLNTSSGLRFYNYWTHNLDVRLDTLYSVVVEIKEAQNINTDNRLIVASSQDSYAGQNWQFNNGVLKENDLINNTVKILNIKTKNTISGNQGLRTYYDNKSLNTTDILTFRISVLDYNSTITKDNFVYEPYYITSDTTVVQDKNHTLKAIWEPNS